jgi:hypothetical protein
MAHFAEIDENSIVTRVLVVANDLEHRGAEFLAEDLGLGGTWVQTSFNANFRYNFAGIGYTYDPIDDAFIAPMPECGHDELLLNNLKRWECSHVEHQAETI